MCDGTNDRCYCGGVPTEPEKPADCPPEDAKTSDDDQQDQACDKKDGPEKSGGCCCG